MSHASRKERITVSLSKESAKFLKATRIEAQSPSISALLEKIIADLRGKIEMERIEAKMRSYYDSLSDAAVQEESAWGALGEAGLASQIEEVEPELVAAER